MAIPKLGKVPWQACAAPAVQMSAEGGVGRDQGRCWLDRTTLDMVLALCSTWMWRLCPYMWRSYQLCSHRGLWVLFLLAIPFRPSHGIPHLPNRKIWKHYFKGRTLAMVPESQAQTAGFLMMLLRGATCSFPPTSGHPSTGLMSREQAQSPNPHRRGLFPAISECTPAEGPPCWL